MNTTRILFIFSLLMILYAQGHSQSNYRGCYGFDCKEKKWSFSIFAGASLLGPGHGVKEQMISSGLDDIRPPYDRWFDHEAEVDYPIGGNGIVLNFEAMYMLTERSGLQLALGEHLHSSVHGYEKIGLGNYLCIHNDVWSASLDYVWKIRNAKDALSIGPEIALHKASAENPTAFHPVVTSTSSFKVGFNIGYSFSLVQKKSWFLSLKAKYTCLPSAEIGPYTVTHVLGELTENPETYTSTFDNTKVNLSTINFGIITGWRF